MQKNIINDISILFDENPIGRSYLYLFYKLNIDNEIIYVGNNFYFQKAYCKIFYKLNLYKPLKYLKSKIIIELLRNIEEYFNLDKNFLNEMYKFDYLFKFKNLNFLKHPNINHKDNINLFKNNRNDNFLNTGRKIFKQIFESGKKFYHIHPGYMYKVRGADGSLNSIRYNNKLGRTFFLMNKKIDNGKIIFREEIDYKKIYFPLFQNFKIKELYDIWYSFIDPAIRVSLLKKLINEKINLSNFCTINTNEENNYFSFLKSDDLSKLFNNSIFRNE